MDLQEFLTELRSTRDQFKWQELLYGLIRCERGDCPIVAIATIRRPERHFDNQFWNTAANTIQLEDKLDYEIVAAADHDPADSHKRHCLICAEKFMPRSHLRALIEDAIWH